MEYPETDKPNMLYVFPDQLSARWLPGRGESMVHAPVLNAFAAQSVCFDRAYSNSPLCTPYRACLLTGQYPGQTGVRENGMALPERQTTLAHHLNDAGYATHYIGKWHLSGEPHANRWVSPEQRAGFQHFIGWESHHVDHNAGLIWYDDPETPRPLSGHETDGLTDIVCEELEAIDTSKPFFMTVSYQAPHAPCSPPDADLLRYDATVLEGPPNTHRDAWFKMPCWNADYGVEEFRKRYFGEITHIDTAFGRILDTLAKTGLDKNTIVIFTSDHGDMAGCHGLFGKGVMYDESVRVPLFVRMPGGQANVVDAAVATVDLSATILDLAGAQPLPAAQGRSLVPCLNGQVIPDTDVFIEYKQDCIIRGDLKLYTERNEDTVSHCFNLKDDPYELNNIAATLDPETKQRLLEAIQQWRSYRTCTPGT